MVKSKFQTFIQATLIIAALVLIGVSVVGNITQDISIKQTFTIIIILAALAIAFQFLKSSGPETLRVEDFIGLAFAGAIVVGIFIFVLPATGGFAQTGMFSTAGIAQTEQLIRGAIGPTITTFLETYIGIITALGIALFIWRDRIVKIRRDIIN